MSPKNHGRFALAAALVTLTFAWLPARAEAALLPWLQLGADAGLSRYDDHLADYQWDVSPRGAWGVQALAGLGPVALGARLSNGRTTQRLGLDGITDPQVSATRTELIARARLFEFAGTRLALTGAAGRQRLAYHPSQLALPGGGTPVVVELAPVSGWIAGGGVALDRALIGPWGATFALERRWFALDTAHSAGGAIVDQHENFGVWDARVGVTWLVTSR